MHFSQGCATYASLKKWSFYGCRATVRELSSTSDAASQLGKLHAELDHVRAKEGLARSALNRSELERLELESQARRLKQQVASLTVQLSVAQDHGR